MCGQAGFRTAKVRISALGTDIFLKTLDIFAKAYLYDYGKWI